MATEDREENRKYNEEDNKKFGLFLFVFLLGLLLFIVASCTIANYEGQISSLKSDNADLRADIEQYIRAESKFNEKEVAKENIKLSKDNDKLRSDIDAVIDLHNGTSCNDKIVIFHPRLNPGLPY